MLVKASIAGAIVTNSHFMLGGASFLLGGLRHHVQEYNRAGGALSGLTHMWNGPGCKIFVWLNRG
jgi:Ca2+/H+ antiporter